MPNQQPVVSGPSTVTYLTNQTFQLSSLISAHDPDGTIASYTFFNSSNTTFLTLNGQRLSGPSLTVSAAQLGAVGYSTGSDAFAYNTLSIKATDDQGLDSAQFSMTVNVMHPLATVSQIADYEVNGYWAWRGQSPHHIPSNTISYNLDALNGNGDPLLADAEQKLAVAALQAWHDVANIFFVKTSGPAQITFTDAGSGISANTSLAGVIDITTGWINSHGDHIGTYGYQTYIHEIGHALQWRFSDLKSVRM